MKRIAVFMVICLVGAATSHAEIFESKFGCKINLPSDWLPVTEEMLQKLPDLFSTHEAFKNADKTALQKIAAQLRQGKMEIFFRKSAVSNGNDSISLTQRPGAIPYNVPTVGKLCAQLPEAMSKLYGRPVKIYGCSHRQTAGRAAVFIDYDGMIDGTRTLHYQIQWSPNVVLSLTASCANEDVEAMKWTLDNIVGSIH